MRFWRNHIVWGWDLWHNHISVGHGFSLCIHSHLWLIEEMTILTDQSQGFSLSHQSKKGTLSHLLGMPQPRSFRFWSFCAQDDGALSSLDTWNSPRLVPRFESEEGRPYLVLVYDLFCKLNISNLLLRWLGISPVIQRATVLVFMPEFYAWPFPWN